MNESSPNQDFNGDGDKTDDITRWVDNGSFSKN